MKAKKSKGKAARKRAVKDLPPRKGADAKGGDKASAGTGKATFNDFSFVHLVDKASPVLLH
jgi:type VI protein secretion system component Hcp